MSTENEFYDEDKVLKAYQARRQRPDNPNDALEKPIFLKLAGDLANLDIIDLGCGDGAFGQEALAIGAKSYVGVEVSSEMVQVARANLADSEAKVYFQSIEDWSSVPEQADLVSARLSLNYIEDLLPVFAEVFKSLRPQGRFIVSVEHPVISSNYAYIGKEKRTSWLVDNYFESGARVHTWLGKEITKYHHTLEGWLELFQVAGFTIKSIRESKPQKENFHSMQEYERRLRIPLFLFIAAQKPY